MAVNYMDRLAALRGDRQHAAGASSHSRSAPVLHADEKSKRKRKKKLSRKQKAALAKGRRVMKQMRSEKKMAKKSRKSRKSPKRSAKRRGGYKTQAAKKTRRLAKLRALAHKQGKTVRKRRKKGVTTYSITKKRKRKKSPSKRKYKRKAKMAKSSKRSRAAKKAARTRARNKAARREAGRKAARKRKRKHGGHKRSGHKRKRGHGRKHGRRRGKKRSAPRRRKRGGRARKRNRGLVRRNNRSGKFVGRGGRIRGRKRRGGYHKAGRVLREGYSMENPLDMGEVVTGLGMGLIGFIVADVSDRMMAGRGPLGGLPAAEAAPIYSDYGRLGVAAVLTIAPLAGAHFINGAKHKHLRTGLQFIGFGAGIRTLGHLVTDVVVAALKSNATVGPTIQSLYPAEIVAAGQIAGAKAAGAGALPEQIGEAMRGLGAIPEGLGACCNATSRMLNTALSPLQPIGRSAENGGAAANYAPGPQALPPPIERIVAQPYSPPSVTRQATPVPMTPPQMTPAPIPPPSIVGQTPATPSAISMQAAYAPQPVLPAVPVGGPSFVGPAGLPASGPFGWADEQ